MMTTNILKDYSLEKPVLSILFLLLICAVFRVIDIFVLRLDEPPVNEIIISKTMGLVFLFVYLWRINSSFRKIGYSTRYMLESAFVSIAFALLGLAVIFGSQYFYLLVKGANPYLTIKYYSLFFIFISVIAGNIINALMEEGLFRGLIITQFLNYIPFWKANLIQASIFGIWHIVWPIKDFYSGKVNSVGALVVMCVGEVFITFLMGLTMGYLFYKTGNLWAAFIWHFIINFTQNILVIRSDIYSMESAVMSISSTAVKGISLIFVLIAIMICAKFLIPFNLKLALVNQD